MGDPARPCGGFPGPCRAVHIRHSPVQDDRSNRPFLMGAQSRRRLLARSRPKSASHFLSNRLAYSQTSVRHPPQEREDYQKQGVPSSASRNFSATLTVNRLLPQRAVHGDLAVHHMDDVLADRHAKARSLNFADPTRPVVRRCARRTSSDMPIPRLQT